MTQLIRYEWKKLISKKINLVLLICLLCLPFLELLIGLNTIEDERSVDNPNNNTPILIKDGIQYDGFSALQKRDENLHNYAGEITKELIERVSKDQEKERNEVFETMSVDEAQMKRFYGENWRHYYELGVAGKLTRGEVNDLRKELGIFSASDEDDSEEARSMSTYIKLWHTVESNIADNSVGKLFPKLYDGRRFLNPEEYLITQENIDLREAASEAKHQLMNGLISEEEWRSQAKLVRQVIYPEGENEAINEYFNEQFLKKSTYYDSTIAAEYYLNIFSMKSFFMPVKCILLGMLLLSVFNQEISNKTDQLMKPMKVSMRKQSIAKYITIILLCVGLALYDMVVYVGTLQALIGFHNLNVVIDSSSIINGSRNITPIYTYQQMVVTCSLLYLVCNVFVASIISFISSVTKRSYSAIIIYAMVIMSMVSIPYIYTMVVRIEMPYKLFLPLQMMCTNNVFSTIVESYRDVIFNQNYLVLFDQVIFAPKVILILVILLSAVIFISVIWYQSRREIKNA